MEDRSITDTSASSSQNFYLDLFPVKMKVEYGAEDEDTSINDTDRNFIVCEEVDFKRIKEEAELDPVCRETPVWETSSSPNMVKDEGDSFTRVKETYSLTSPDVSQCCKVVMNDEDKDKPFKCQECHKCFKLKSYLTVHLRVHTGERPYRCKLCESSFSQRSTLNNHKRLHSNKRPYACPQCPATFKLATYLNIHLKNHPQIRRFAPRGGITDPDIQNDDSSDESFEFLNGEVMSL